MPALEGAIPAQLLVALLDERQDYPRMQAAEARAAADQAGLSAEVVFAESNAIVQIHQLFPRVHAPEAERPKLILVQCVSGEGLQRVAHAAVRVGIGWIVLNRRVAYLDELRRSRPDLPIGCVTPNQLEIGRIQGRQARALAPAGGLLLYVQGPRDTSASQDRLRGTQEVLAGQPFRWKILNGDWSETSGHTAVAGWLRLKTSEEQRPTLLVAQNDAMAAGARRAILAPHADWAAMPVIGCDGLPAHGQRLVESGQMAATVVVPATAGDAVRLAARWLRDGQLPPPELVLTPRSFPPEGELPPR